jgi:signal transduction histidine kinase
MTEDPGGTPPVDLPRQLARRLLPAAVAVGVLIGLVAPALIWYFQVSAIRENAQVHARDFERHLQSFVLENGALWRYQAQKYLETLRRFLPEKEIRRITVTDERGQPMTALEFVAEPIPGEWPNVPVRASIPAHFNNRVIAHVTLEVSTARATESAARMFAVLAIVGVAFGLFMFLLPMSVARRLDRRVKREMGARDALYQAAEAHLDQTRRLAVATREVAATLDPYEAAARAVTCAQELFDARTVRLWAGSAEAPAAVAGPAPTDEDLTHVAAVLTTCHTRREPRPHGGERWIVPLVAGVRCVGAIQLTTTKVVEPVEAELVGLFASKVATAIVNGQLHEGMRRALHQVSQQNAELDSFVHTVSHDLKAPLIAIRGFATALAEALPPDTDAAVAHCVQRIEINVDHMGRLLRDMLELSQVGRTAHAADLVPVGPVVQEVLADLQAEIEARKVTVVVGDLGEVCGARSELYSVFQNLVGNAVKYLGDAPEPRVEIGCEWRDDVAEFFVRDNGIGIDPAYHVKVFKLFERLREVPASGTGVGLAIVRRIVEHAGGHVRVESERGHGATFAFTWPRPSADLLALSG